MIWTILSIAFVMIDELHDNVPKWFSLVMVAPYLLIIILWVAPAMLMIWGRRLSWPFRKVHSMLGRRHDG